MGYEVSIIIPCYNSEETLCRCIESIINQSLGFENIEILLYDDASKDKTRQIILDYANKYENIIPLTTDVNTGQGIGRNKCMELASADYFMFLDSDDEFTENMCEVLLNEIKNQNADMITCNYLNNHNSVIREIFNKWKLGTVEENKVIFYDEEMFYLINWVVWLSIFRKDIIKNNNITFSSNAGEDMHFIFKYLIHAKKSIYLKDFFGVLRYTQDDSISYSYSIQDLNEFLELSIDSINILSDKDLDFSFIFKSHVGFMISQTYVSNKNLLKSYKKELAEFFKELSNFEKKYNLKFDFELPIRIANFLILHGQHKLCVYNLVVLNKLYKSNLLKNTYRKLLNK